MTWAVRVIAVLSAARYPQQKTVAAWLHSPGIAGRRALPFVQSTAVIGAAWFLLAAGQATSGRIARALSLVLLFWLGAALVTFHICLAVSLESMKDVVLSSIRVSAAAAWFVPAVALLGAGKPAAVLVGLVLAVNTTRLVTSRWLLLTRRGQSRRPLRPALGWTVACAAHAGIVANLWNRPMLAALCYAVACAVLTWLFVTRGAYRPRNAPGLARGGINAALTALMAATLVSTPAGVESKPGLSATELVFPTETADVAIGGGRGLPGVVLKPQRPPVRTVLIAARETSLNATPTEIMSIPFSGEYWMFQLPSVRPPRGSLQRRGTPLEISLHTLDSTPMEMEARQMVDPPIDLRCCRDIELVISSKAPWGSVSLELVVSDLNRSATLGRATVGIGEILTFRLPASTPVRRLAELRIIFHRSSIWMDKSANIAIERIVLTPK